MGALRIRERLAGIQSETEHYEEMVEELIWNEVSSFKKMYLKDRKIENIMLIGDVFTDSVYQNIEEKRQKSFPAKTLIPGMRKLSASHRWSRRKTWYSAGKRFTDVSVCCDL